MLVFRTQTNRKTLENAVKAGRLRRLASGIYSTDLATDPAAQICQGLVPVLAYLRPEGLISHRSALVTDFGASEGFVVITDPRLSENYLHTLPGLRILAVSGPRPLSSDTRLKGIFVSSVWRAALENKEPRRRLRSLGRSITLETKDLEALLAARLTSQVEVDGFLQGLKVVTDDAQAWATERGALERWVRDRGARLTLGADPLFLSPLIDHPRLALFEDLARQLLRGLHGNEALWGAGLPPFPSRPAIDDRRFLNLAFYESYFSNYIEGTEFPPEEAHEIALDPRPAGQGKEGHDIRALYSLYADPEIFLRADHTPDEFLANLKFWHTQFGAHTDKAAIRPGQFKNRANRAGSTWFTDPAQVEGTLRAAWEIGLSLTEPFDQSVFRAVSTVSVHPFLDGNGRITRLAASNLLGRAGKARMMIPTVFREDYLLAVRAFSNGNPVPVIRMFRQAALITASVPFEQPFADLTRWLKARNAFAAPDEARWHGF